MLWTKKDVHIERIDGDKSMWNMMVAASKEFFVKTLLPELVGKFYSRKVCISATPKEKPTVATNSDPPTTYCFCGQPEDFDNMIGCDDDKCKLQWYHMV